MQINDYDTDRRRFVTSIFISGIFVFLIWMVFIFEKGSNSDFSVFGINPRTLSGLQGILFAPFIHSDINHIVNNTATLILLMSALFFFYPLLAFRVFFTGWLLTNLLVWIFARPSYHIGASGVLYAIAFFLVISGMISRNTRLSVLSLLVIFFYGSMIWGIFPQKDGISWESHLAGAISGVGLSLWFREHFVSKQQYEGDDNEDEDEDNNNSGNNSSIENPGYFSSYSNQWFGNNEDDN